MTKQIETTFQEFLKKQQAGQLEWAECKRKLTEEQIELLDAYKGHLSYFS